MKAYTLGSIIRYFALIVGIPPFLIKGEVGPSKNWVTKEGVQNFLLERGDKPEKGGGGDAEMGGCHFFITLHFNHIYCVGGK